VDKSVVGDRVDVGMFSGKKSPADAAHQLLAAVLTPVETVHHRGLHRKIEDAASAAKRVLS